MNPLRIKLMCAALTGMLAWVAGAVAEPTTAPSPVTTSVGMKPDPRVLVFAFTPISQVPAQDWTGRGIQENLQSEVSRTGATLVLPPHAPADNEDAITFARENQADVAVVGTYQIVGNQIRANGQLIEVVDNKSLGGFSATGSQQDLFKVEDALGEQLRSLLPSRMTTQAAEQVFEQPAVTPPVPDYNMTDNPAYTYSEPPATVNNYYSAPADPTYSYYPNYDGFYDYPLGFGYFGGFGYGYVGRGYGHHDHENNHGFGGRPYGGFGGGRGGSPAFRGGGLHGGFSGGFSGGLHGGFSGGFSGGGHGGGGHR